jgi:hypothetical protein
MMTQCNSLYGIDFTLTYNVHTCDADYKPFWSHGYAAVQTHQESHGYYHTPQDTIDKVSTAYALKNSQLGMAVLAQVAEVQGVTQLREARGLCPSLPNWGEYGRMSFSNPVTMIDGSLSREHTTSAGLLPTTNTLRSVNRSFSGVENAIESP